MQKQRRETGNYNAVNCNYNGVKEAKANADLL